MKQFEPNPNGRDFVVGDIHGCWSKLTDDLKQLNFNFDTDRLFCTGDLVDRGPESHLALEWLAYPWFHSVRGNHEDMAIGWAECDPNTPDGTATLFIRGYRDEAISDVVAELRDLGWHVQLVDDYYLEIK